MEKRRPKIKIDGRLLIKKNTKTKCDENKTEKQKNENKRRTFIKRTKKKTIQRQKKRSKKIT